MLYEYDEIEKGKKKRYKGHDLTITKELGEDGILCGITAFREAKKEDFEKDAKYDILEFEETYYRIRPKCGFDLMPRYIKVTGDNNYVRLKHNWFIPILLMLLLLLSGITIFFATSSKNPDGPGYTLDLDGDPWDGNPYQNTDDTAFQETISILIPNNLVVNKSNKCIKLVNPKENTVYLKYIVYEYGSDVVLAETGDVAPGYSVEDLDLYSIFDKGVHKLRIKVVSRDVETLEECQGSYINVNLTVK